MESRLTQARLLCTFGALTFVHGQHVLIYFLEGFIWASYWAVFLLIISIYISCISNAKNPVQISSWVLQNLNRWRICSNHDCWSDFFFFFCACTCMMWTLVFFVLCSHHTWVVGRKRQLNGNGCEQAPIMQINVDKWFVLEVFVLICTSQISNILLLLMKGLSAWGQVPWLV